MYLEEQRRVERAVPSSYTLLKAEFGFIGDRNTVFTIAKQAASERWFENE